MSKKNSDYFNTGVFISINSPITGICSAASSWAHILTFPPYKIYLIASAGYKQPSGETYRSSWVPIVVCVLLRSAGANLFLTVK